MQLAYKVCYIKYEVPIHLWRIEPIPKGCKVAKWYDHRYLKFFLSLFVLPMMIQVSKKTLIWLKKVSSARKTINKQTCKVS